MASLSAFGLAFYVLVMTGAFAVRSAAGFGAVLVAVPMLAFVMPVSMAVSVTTVLTATASMSQMRRDWQKIAWRQVLLISFYTVIGIAIGFYFISILDEHALRRGLGVFLMIYSVYAVWTANTPMILPARWHDALAAGAGVAGGLVGALFGGGVGPIYVVYFNTLRLDRYVFRVTMSTVTLLGGAARIAGYASFGFYGHTAFKLIAAGLPLVLVGSWLGDRLVRRLDPRTFCRFVGGLIFLSGAALVLK